jgi:hypothetical protein
MSNLVSEQRPFQTIHHPSDITNRHEIMRDYFPMMHQQELGLIAPPLNQFISMSAGAFTPVQSAPSSGVGGTPIQQISTESKNKKKFVSNLNLNAKNVNKKKSECSEASSNKRNPAKKDITKKYIGGKKEGNDGNDGNGGKPDDSDDEEDDDEEEDPDAALFAKKKSSMSPTPNAIKEETKEVQHQAPKFTLAGAPGIHHSVSKGKIEKEEEKKGPITFDKIILPSRGSPTSGALNLTAENLAKFDRSQVTKAQEANKVKEELSGEESLGDISVSTKNLETNNTIFGQYMKVNRTKQRYR